MAVFGAISLVSVRAAKKTRSIPLLQPHAYSIPLTRPIKATSAPKARRQKRIGGTYSASPVYAAGRVYFQSEQGTGVVLKAGKQFKLLARNRLGEPTLASFAAADGALFIRTEGNLYQIQAR